MLHGLWAGKKHLAFLSFLFYNKDGDGLGRRVRSCLPTLMTWVVGQRTGMMARRPCFTYFLPFCYSLFPFFFPFFPTTFHLLWELEPTAGHWFFICGQQQAVALITVTFFFGQSAFGKPTRSDWRPRVLFTAMTIHPIRFSL
jgi:hypothetical protein